ncbi:hypothetical protein J2X69_001285 [Algoriphagus sp. 4150]|nr:hypothetical protein [Algoriphagus sp. 4150]
MLVLGSVPKIQILDFTVYPKKLNKIQHGKLEIYPENKRINRAY